MHSEFRARIRPRRPATADELAERIEIQVRYIDQAIETLNADRKTYAKLRHLERQCTSQEKRSSSSASTPPETSDT